MDELDLTNLTPEPVTTVDLTADRQAFPVRDPKAVEAKAVKYAIAMGDQSPDLDTIKNIITSGTEAGLRSAAVAQDYFQRQQHVEPLVQSTLQHVDGTKPGDAEFVRAIGTVEPKDPDTVLEEKLGEKAVNIVLASDTNPDRAVEEEQSPVGAETLNKITQDLIANKMLAADMLDKYREFNKSTSWPEWGYHFAKNFIPGFQWYTMSGGAELSGSAVSRKVSELYALPPSQFKVALQEEVARLAITSPQAAEDFLKAMQVYGASDADLANFFDVVDAATAVSPTEALQGVKVLRGGKGLQNSKNLLKATAKAGMAPEVTPESLLANTGQIEDAADISALKAAGELFAPKNADTDTIKDVASLLELTPSLFNPKYFLTKAGSATAIRAGRMVDLMANNIEAFGAALQGLKPATLTDEALQAAYVAAEEQYRKVYPALSDNITGVHYIAPEALETNTPRMIVTIGQDSGSKLFDTVADARKAATQKYKLKDYLIEEDAGKYVITQRVDIGDNFAESLSKLITTENTSNNNTWTRFKGWAGAKEQVSKFQAEQRAAATHFHTRFAKMLSETAAPALNRLSKGEKRDLDVIMAINRDSERVKGKPETRGMFYESLGELQEAYQRHLSRMPSEAEEDAYFTMRQLSDFDYYLRSISLKKAKIRMGYSEHNMRVWDPEKRKYRDMTLDAKFVDDLPFNSRDDANVMFLMDKETQGVARLSDFTEAQKADLKKLQEAGYKIVQVLNPKDKALGIKQAVQFIVTRDSKASPLKLAKQVDYNPGFHVEYSSDYYIAQPKWSWNKGRRAYIGDDTMLAVSNSAKGREELKKIEEARQLFNAKKFVELDAYLKDNLPWNRKQFEELFKRFDPKQSLYLVRNGRTVSDPSSVNAAGRTLANEHSEFDNLIDSPFNDSAKLNQEFLGEKNGMLRQIEQSGTQTDPVYRLTNADMYSPLDTQIRAMGRLIRNQAFEDYQFGAVNSFIEEFGNMPNIGSVFKFNGNPVSIDQLRRNPMFYFKHATIDHPNKNFQAQANQIKANIEHLVGTPSQYQLSLDNYREKLMDWAYQKGGEKATKYVPVKVSPWINDPAQHARTMVSDIKLGMFNPVQMFVQGATFGNIVSISPIHGLAQTPVTMVMKYMLNNPNHIDWYAEQIGKVYDAAGVVVPKKYRWDATKIRESYEGFERSGFGIIGGEYAWRDNISDAKLFNGKTRRFLDKSYVFFNHTESLIRIASWNTAYSEYLANSGKIAGKLTDNDFRKILSRAQTYSGNMTRDNNAFWQRGLASSFTQFYGYTGRMIELLAGRQLTVPQKARLGLGIGLLYGFPPAAGLGLWYETGDPQAFLTALNPFDEDLRTYALSNGINIDETTWGVVNNGLASAALYLATGQNFDIATRFSPLNIQSLDNIKRSFEDENTAVAIIETALGASGSIVSDIVQSIVPITKDFYRMVGQGESSDLLLQDFINAFREISTVNNAYKIISAVLGIDYLSKKGNIISDGDRSEDEKWSLILEGLTGPQNYNQTDMYRTFSVKDQDKADVSALRKEVNRYAKFYLDAVHKGDTDAATQYRNRMEALLNGAMLTERDKLRMWNDSMDQKSLNDIIWKSFSKDNPAREKLIEERKLGQ